MVPYLSSVNMPWKSIWKCTSISFCFFFFLIAAVLMSRLQEDYMLDSGKMSTNCHISGVALRSTIVNSLCSILGLRKVHIIWQKIEKISLLPSQPVPKSGIPTWHSGDRIPFCMRTIIFRQPDQVIPPLFFLLSLFFTRDDRSW